ncbi:MAG: hypothetical protein ACRBDI_07335 [Alphaproteobacteria bacterium]
MDSTSFADLAKAFGKQNGAKSIVQNGEPVIDDLEEAVDYLISDDTGMNAFDFNGGNSDFPITLHFNKDKSAEDIARGLADRLSQANILTGDGPVQLEDDMWRVMPNVFVRESNIGVDVNIPDLPPELV